MAAPVGAEAMRWVRMEFDASVHPDRQAQIQAGSFSRGVLDPALHYAGPRQALRWQAVHRAHAPAGRGEGLEHYVRAMQAGAAMTGRDGWLVALGCGGGAKEAAWLRQAGPAGAVAMDVSPALVWRTWEAWQQARPGLQVRGLVADLKASADWAAGLASWTGDAPRLVTFFGLLPNLEPEEARRVLEAVVRPGDELVVGANLAPGDDGLAGAERVLPQYANPETEHWLEAALEDVDLAREAWDWVWDVMEVDGWARIRARACFTAAAEARWDGGGRCLQTGECIEVFFSNRPTAAQVRAWLEAGGWRVQEEWLASDGEEGTWLARRIVG